VKNRFDLVVFDWDGTLFDSIGWILECLNHASDQVGLQRPAEDAARSVIGLSLQQAMKNLHPEITSEEARQLVEHYRAHYNTEGIQSLGLFKGVEEMLQVLRAEGFKLAVATGKARSGLNRALLDTGMTDFFDATRCADETHSKPHPRMMEELMQELGVEPDRTLLIGDSHHDMQLAQNAGVSAIAVGCGANRLDDLRRYEPLACFQHTSELLTLLS
jgi:phosphoglycolate phosphatase